MAEDTFKKCSACDGTDKLCPACESNQKLILELKLKVTFLEAALKVAMDGCKKLLGVSHG